MRRSGRLVAAALLMGGVAPAIAAAGDDAAQTREAPTSLENKLTLAYYQFSSAATGFDVNLRHTFATTTAWIGAYHETSGFDQVRVGYEYDYRGPWLTLVPSVQAATHGFLGASVYAEAGRPLFAIGGAGRTNLQGRHIAPEVTGSRTWQ